MHPSLPSTFGHLAGGLLWLTAAGRITSANARARTPGGFEAGQQPVDSTLQRAVAVVASGRDDRPIDREYLPPAGERRRLHAQTMPAMAPDEALRQAKVISTTLQRLVDRSTRWSSESLLADDRIEVWPLLWQTWTQLQPFAESRRLTVRLIDPIDATAMPVTHGSEFWIRRVLLERLQAALRHAAPGATLDIELRLMGPRVRIVFRHSGPWPAAAGLALAAKDLIGLHLCERIIRLHGGLLREEDDDGLRNVLIDLPTGAPGRDARDATMEAAQARRLAADRAALMARRRKTPAAG